jgi:Na+-translocating ferredoxin:NAD+ oxidoreductase RnfC subunit
MQEHKDEVISFKVEGALAQAIRRLPNRSAFIRAAVLAAMGNACPLCQGTGIMTPQQKRHWEEFSRHHEVRQCRECDAVHLVCASGSEAPAHPGGRKPGAGRS